PPGMKSNVVDANRAYRFNQPEKIDYAARLAHLQAMLRFKKPIMSPAEFEDQAARAREQIESLPGCANVFSGVHLPVCAPRYPMKDIGKSLDRFLLPAVGRSYGAQFPDRKFKNWRSGELMRQVTVVPESRYATFVGEIRKSPLVWWHFPRALQGFSIGADREQMAALPTQFILAGPVSTSFACIMYPDVLCRDGRVQALDCAAVQWRGPERSLCFNPSDSKLGFGGGSLSAGEYCSGGVLVLRQA
ncbi:MAG: hypothetical protein UY92_C0004G0001, partial [Candidatus Magasanikbacteria bacterium GW2011_GWA2_56_11]